MARLSLAGLGVAELNAAGFKIVGLNMAEVKHGRM